MSEGGETRNHEGEARELLRAWDARKLDNAEHPASHGEWAEWMENAANALRLSLDAARRSPQGEDHEKDNS